MAIEIKAGDAAQEEVIRLDTKLDMASLEAPDTPEEIAAREAEAAAEKTGEKEEEEKTEVLAEEIAAADAKAAELAAAEKLKTAEADPSTTAEEIKELRTLLRELKQDNLHLRSVVERHEKVQKSEMGAEVKPEEIEELIDSIKSVGSERSAVFAEMVEMMELNPKFEDVREVCTKENFNDIFEMVAKVRVDNGQEPNLDLAILRVKNEIWHMPNPYRYMHGVIKEFHPDYAGKTAKQEEKKEETKETKETTKKTAEEIVREKKAVTAPSSVAGLGGGSTDKAEWTAERIDALSETKLSTVPREIYAAYLRGELD